VVAVTVPPDEEAVPLLKLVAVVAVAAFPVHDPEDPVTLPVTLPVTFPVTLPIKAAFTVAALMVPPDPPEPVLMVGFVVLDPKLIVDAIAFKVPVVVRFTVEPCTVVIREVLLIVFATPPDPPEISTTAPVLSVTVFVPELNCKLFMVVVPEVKFPLKFPLKVVAVTVPPEEEEVPLLKLVAVVAVAAFPVHDPEDPVTLPVTFPVTFPVTLPVKGPENDVAVTVPETFALPDTVSFPVMANVPPEGVMLLMMEDTA